MIVDRDGASWSVGLLRFFFLSSLPVARACALNDVSELEGSRDARARDNFFFYFSFRPSTPRRISLFFFSPPNFSNNRAPFRREKNSAASPDREKRWTRAIAWIIQLELITARTFFIIISEEFGDGNTCFYRAHRKPERAATDERRLVRVINK